MKKLFSFRYHVLAGIMGLVCLGYVGRCSNEASIESEIKKCKRDAILFNRSTEMIDRKCYVIMDDGVRLPQMIYWFNHYIK